MKSPATMPSPIFPSFVIPTSTRGNLPRQLPRSSGAIVRPCS